MTLRENTWPGLTSSSALTWSSGTLRSPESFTSRTVYLSPSLTLTVMYTFFLSGVIDTWVEAISMLI
ncbi:hypothetical protein D3C85_1459950 [compost metagenome]